jgi:stage III sporulation protein AG
MKMTNKPEVFERVFDFVKKNKFVLLVVIVGLVLILLPTAGKSTAKEQPTGGGGQTEVFSLAEQEERIAKALSKIEGAGKVTVVLTMQSGTEQVYARDETYSKDTSRRGDAEETSLDRSSKAVLVSSGSATQKPLTVKTIYPVYQGALVVCEGADSATVRLEIIRAVAGLTGLSTDKIVVAKMNKS